MIAALLALVGTPGMAAEPATAGIAAPSPALEAALLAELTRDADLALPGAERPSFILYDLLDGDIRSAVGEDGGRVSSTLERFRSLRTEVRVADGTLDSSNFRAFGEPDGVVTKRLPVQDDEVALRREIWLATDAAYKQSIEQLSRKRAARQKNPAPHPPDWSPAPPVDRRPGANAATALSSPEIDALAASLSAAAMKPGIENVQAVARDWHGWRLTVSSEGTRAWSPTGNVVIRVEASARRPDGTEVRDARWWVETDAARLPSAEALRAEAAAMADALLASAAGPDPEPWLGPVLFEGPAAAELFSQLLAAEVSGTPPEESDEGPSLAAPPTARLGRRLLPEGWSVWDDPGTTTGAAGEYGLDHEAVAPRKVSLVENGVLRDTLMSRIPSKDRQQSTGHGRALGENRRVAMPGYVRVTAPRKLSERALRKAALRLATEVGLSRVLVIRRLRPPPMVERLDITFSGEGPPPGLTPPYEACFLDRSGMCTPTRSLRFSGVDRRSLRDIVAAGPSSGPINMLDGAPGPERFTIGSTGGVPTTWEVPSVLLTEMELEPSPGGEPRVLRW